MRHRGAAGLASWATFSLLRSSEGCSIGRVVRVVQSLRVVRADTKDSL